jgi:excisionase family DNA binding protein
MTRSPTHEVMAALRAAAQAQRATADALDALAAVLCTVEQAGEPSPQAAPADPEALLTIAQAAGRLGMSESWVYRAVEEGRLPSVRMGNRRRVRPADLAAFVQARADRAGSRRGGGGA